MTTQPGVGEGQAAYWSGAGVAWVEEQKLLDHVLAPFERLLVDDNEYAPGVRVLDVGCGTGTTTLGVAARTRAGHCTGVDISAPVIEAARARAAHDGLAARTTFICADAQSHAFEPGSFDVVISRFGVMFFEDSVAAFANLRRAARAGARMRFVAWRSPAENPFMTTAERAAAPLLPAMPPRDPDAPGQFGLADPSKIQRVLGEGGWSQVDIRPIDPTCTFPERELVRYFTRLGPLGRFLEQQDEPTRQRVIAAVRPAFDPFVHGDEVRIIGACWDVSARA
jgi:SAM-dependent methyltransferase